MIRFVTLVLLALTCLAPAASSLPGLPLLHLEEIRIEGLERTDRSAVLEHLGLAEETTVGQAELVDAVARLRESDLLAGVEFYTRPGSSRGRIVLVLETTEHRRDPRWSVELGAGNSDNDGWYFIPIRASVDQLFGERDRLTASYSIGYRFGEVSLAYRDFLDADKRTWWGLTAAGGSSVRHYVLDGLEVSHRVDRGYLGLDFGRRLSSRLTLECQLRGETADPTDYADYAADSEFRDVEEGQDIPLADLPAEIAGAVERRRRGVLDASLTWDARADQRTAFTPDGGGWIQLRTRTTADGGDVVPFGSLDLRAYRPLLGGVLAGRLRGAVVGEDAPFYDRLYLGGLYTVRGVPSHGLTQPGGAEWLWNGSLEYRAPLSGDPARPSLAGAVFVDFGQSGDAVEPSGRDVAVGAGWGLRWRWFGIVMGPDLAIPLTGSPVEELFHASFSIGWSF